jgi:phosphoglycerol transferase MdoB-like AlkP superfamily enzyme
MVHRLFPVQWIQARPALCFWLAFVILNGLLFLPLYLLNQESASFWPGPALFADGLWLGVNRLLIWRENLDPLRLSLELTLVVALWSNNRSLQRPAVRGMVAGIYLVALSYYLYEAIMVSIYRTDPVFYSHYFLVRDGLPFLARHLQTSIWLYIGGIVGLAVALSLVLGLLNVLLISAMDPKLPRWTRTGVALLAGLVLVTGLCYQHYTASPEMVVSSLGFKLQKNIASSRQLFHDIASFDDTRARQAYNYASYQLQQKPDIYLIFIESYGSVLYKRTDYHKAYTALLAELEDKFAEAGWHTRSTLSESPTWGGGSWLAYTSLLLGLRIDNHPQYLSLLNKYQVERYPGLGHYLQSQGYYYAWVSSIANELDDQLWSKYIRFTGVDAWLRHSDLNYSGPEYGWGPAPPDQYVLPYADQLLQARTDQPLFFVTLTQNSHYPWTPLPTLVEDWRTLAEVEAQPMAPPQEDVERSVKRQNYLRAIEYQLRMLTDFILNTDNEESLFILVGDHQPPQVSRRSDGWATPVHLISRNGALVDSFAEYGFTPGLTVQSLEPSLHHEGFYSLFVRVLQSRYGADRIALPPYLPGGVTMEAQP